MVFFQVRRLESDPRRRSVVDEVFVYVRIEDAPAHTQLPR